MKTVSTDDCWLFANRLDPKGYGHVSEVIDGKYKDYKAYRVVYENLVGPIPEGLTIDHLCRVPACINPDHLEPVTLAENIHRAAPWLDKGLCKHGHVLAEVGIFTRKMPNGRIASWCRECKRLIHVRGAGK